MELRAASSGEWLISSARSAERWRLRDVATSRTGAERRGPQWRVGERREPGSRVDRGGEAEHLLGEARAGHDVPYVAAPVAAGHLWGEPVIHRHRQCAGHLEDG